MKIFEAKQKLMELAQGEYHYLEYKIQDYGNGRFSQECTIYINGKSIFTAKHWETAFAQLEQEQNETSVISEDNVPVSIVENT